MFVVIKASDPVEQCREQDHNITENINYMDIILNAQFYELDWK